MNWKNVLYLLRVERKSSRLIRGVKKTRYRENGIIAYWPYWVAAIIGAIGGLLANLIVSAVYAVPDIAAAGLPPLPVTALGFFVAMPTLVLILCIVFTMLQQIQLSGIKASTQVMYWLPVTWQENTLASVLANLLGFPLATVIAFAAGVVTFAAFNGLVVPALITTVILFGAAFMGSATTEILRVLQLRFVGAVYKSSGRAAIWVRLAGSLLFFLIFYIVYLSITQRFTDFIQGLTTFQNVAWFFPYVWPGLTLYYILNSVVLQGAIFVALSVLFMVGLFFFAVFLNMRFGLYEPPAITVQKSGTVYVPKTGFLGKLGFSSVEAALIRKDLRSFTRRRELISVFIIPIVFVLIPIMQSFGLTSTGNAPVELNLFFLIMTFLFPPGLMAMTLGNMLIGEEGQAVWRIYASPISPKNLVRSKLFFLLMFSTVILLVTGTLGIIIYHPSIKLVVVAFLEGLFVLLAVGSIALTIGFKGADFSAARRARMIRQEWALISLVVCAVAALGVLAPLIPFVLTIVAGGFFVTGAVATDLLSLAIAVVISGIISAVITVIFYRVNLGSATELIRKAEV